MKQKSDNKYMEHKKTEMLNKIDKEQLYSNLLNPNCQALSTTIVQLFTASEDTDMEWIKQDAGVLCFERDSNWRSYFFRLYCLLRNEMIWEHEIYQNMQYLAPKPFFHTFEAEGCIVAFNFANDGNNDDNNEEAEYMKKIVLEKMKRITKKEKYRMEKSTWYHDDHLSEPTEPEPASIPKSKDQSKWNKFINLKKPTGTKSKNRADKNSKKNKDIRIEIGCPENVRHIAGYNNLLEKMNKVDGKFLKQAGVSEDLLKDPKAVEFIANFIEKHEAWEVLKIDPKLSSQNTLPPGLPPRSESSSGVNIKLMHPTPLPPPLLPIPKDVLVSGNNACPIPTKPIRKDTTASSNPPPLLPPSSTKSPPPPPPPPPPAPAPTPSKENFSNTVPSPVITGNDPRSALMDAIKKGTALKPVDRDAAKVDNPRGELLDNIRKGVQLKSVQPPEKLSYCNTLSKDGFAAALNRALEARAAAIHSECEDSDSEDEDSDTLEWDVE